MKQNLFFIITLLTCAFTFSFVEASSDNYEISKVPLTIERFIQDDKLQLHIKLPDGLEIPNKYGIYEGKSGLTCRFSTKVIDGTLFPDSEGYPLTNLDIVVQANNNSENHTMTLVIQLIKQVIQKTNNVRKSTTTTTINYQQMQVNVANQPNLSVLEGDPHQGMMTFDIIFTD